MRGFMKSQYGSATTTYFEREGKRPVVIVTIDGAKAIVDNDPIETAALLVHEAVHIWQFMLDVIGERVPSSEFQAYGIQAIAQELMLEFQRQMYTS
jgi:hypothetical protein